MTFVYKPENADDLGAKADYFFEYKNRPSKLGKILYALKYFFSNPLLYISLFRKYFKIYPKFSRETFIYSSYGVWVDGVISYFKPDIIACQTTLIKTFMVAEIARMRQIPVVFEPYAEIHDLKMGVNKHLNENEREKYWKYFLSLSELVIGMDNCSVGPLMYLPKEKVKVFYDTCDFQFYQQKLSEGKNELRASFGLPKDMFLLTMTGAYHYRKGHDELIKAVSILNKKGHKDIGAVLVGGNVGKEKWIDLAKNEDVLANVFFLQNLSEEKKLRLYRSTDGYCNLSNSTRSCGLDLALLEAMSCAIPVIVYDNGALGSAVSNSNGFLVRTGDTEALAEAILELYLKTPEERSVMAEGSRQFASKTDLNLTSKIKEGWFLEIVSKYKKK
jgi:glycosyltransferase involved in cell wall biosynthesis